MSSVPMFPQSALLFRRFILSIILVMSIAPRFSSENHWVPGVEKSAIAVNDTNILVDFFTLTHSSKNYWHLVSKNNTPHKMNA